MLTVTMDTCRVRLTLQGFRVDGLTRIFHEISIEVVLDFIWTLRRTRTAWFRPALSELLMVVPQFLGTRILLDILRILRIYLINDRISLINILVIL